MFNFCFSTNIVTHRGDSDLIGNVTDDACVRIRSDDLEAVNCACSGLVLLKGSWKRVDVYDTIFIAND